MVLGWLHDLSRETGASQYVLLEPFPHECRDSHKIGGIDTSTKEEEGEPIRSLVNVRLIDHRWEFVDVNQDITETLVVLDILDDSCHSVEGSTDEGEYNQFRDHRERKRPRQNSALQTRSCRRTLVPREQENHCHEAAIKNLICDRGK